MEILSARLMAHPPVTNEAEKTFTCSNWINKTAGNEHINPFPPDHMRRIRASLAENLIKIQLGSDGIGPRTKTNKNRFLFTPDQPALVACELGGTIYGVSPGEFVKTNVSC